MLIDFHAHIYPDKIAEKAAENVGRFYQVHTCCDGKVSTLLERGRLAGVDKFVVHSVAQTPAQVENINRFISSVCQEYPETFIGFGALHRDTPHFADEIEKMIALGLKGLKLHPDIQLFDLDDPKMFELYEMLQGKLPLLLHCGDYRYSYSHPSRLARVLDNFPKLTVIAAHFGGWSIYDLALEYLKDRKCYLDISSSIMYLGRRRSEELIRLYGAERMLYGTDYPMWDPVEELRRFDSLHLTNQEKELILYQNALQILS
ncbi:MAG: amidohydrolase family protein [Clostridiales bacterium]|nr:amidohydrolase family protein [Clostridiales bacterium]